MILNILGLEILHSTFIGTVISQVASVHPDRDLSGGMLLANRTPTWYYLSKIWIQR